MSLLFPEKDSVGISIIKLQKWIAKTLFIILIALILFNILGDPKVSQTINNSYLPIISGWIGIILGFYFSREFSGILAEKLKQKEEELGKVTSRVYKNSNEALETLIEVLRRKDNKHGTRR